MLRLKCAPALPVILAAALLLLPWGWVGAFLAAAAVHELGHVLAVRIFGGKIVEMTLGLHGAQIRTTPMDPKFQLPAILAGPIFGLLPVLLWEKCPRLAFCATLLSAWNLLPIYPLDGGRALRLLLRRNCKWAEWLLPPLFCWASCCIAWVSPSGGQVWPFQKNCLQTSGKTGTIGAIQK